MKGKWGNLVPGCVISMFKLIFINQSVVSTKGSRNALWLLRHGGATTHDFFRRTAKYLITCDQLVVNFEPCQHM